MRYIKNVSTDPAFNLAAEEWLLRHTAEDVFMLWRNAPSVIVGRNQNARAQIDADFVRRRNIPVIRRLSGGGAVFHDLGNVNFTFISLGRAAGSGLDFRRFTAPVVAALRSMGVECAFDGRNDLTLNGRKISGNAQHISGDRLLHHGTLLFSAGMADLSGALRVDPQKYRDKAVKSVAMRVTNIAAHLPPPGMTVVQFMDRLMAFVSGGRAAGGGNASGEAARGEAACGEAALAFTPDEATGIEELARTKYRTWEWNFGRAPEYGFVRSARTAGGMLEAHLDVDGGVIRRARLLGEYFGERDIAELERMLVGCRHDRAALTERLAGVDLDAYLRGVSPAELLDCLF